jgi:aspartate kinase
LAEAQINIQNAAIREIVMSCIVDQKDGDRALQVLHFAFGLDKAEE